MSFTTVANLKGEYNNEQHFHKKIRTNFVTSCYNYSITFSEKQTLPEEPKPFAKDLRLNCW